MSATCGVEAEERAFGQGSWRRDPCANRPPRKLAYAHFRPSRREGEGEERAFGQGSWQRDPCANRPPRKLAYAHFRPSRREGEGVACRSPWRALYANGVMYHSPGLVAGGLPEAAYGRVHRQIAPLPQRGCVTQPHVNCRHTSIADTLDFRRRRASANGHGVLVGQRSRRSAWRRRALLTQS